MTKITAFFYILFHSFLVIHAQENKLENLLKEINPQGFTGFELYDSDTNKVLYSHHSDQYFIPASNVKIFTFNELFSLKQDSIPSILYYEKKDSIFILPLGDPTYLDERFSSVNLDQFFGITSQTICIDLSNFYDQHYAPGWTWDDFQYSYMPERNIFPIGGNLVTKGDAIHSYFSTDSTLKNRRKIYSNHFNLTESKKTPFITSNSLIIQFLSDRYKKKIIEVNSFDLQKELKVIYSNPIKSVLREMMLESDNFLAEMLAINSVLFEQNFHQPCGMIDRYDKGLLFDASGLSRYNLVTTKAIVNELVDIQHKIHNYLEYFPENGVSGTLKNSYLKEKSYVFAKTGSMSGVFNLSGYLKTNSGKILIFSLMNNNFIEKGSNLKPRIEALLLYIKHHY